MTNQKSVKILVIQLARLGDTLQSLMALRAAKQLYPQLSIHLVVRETFADAVKRVPWIDYVYTLPTKSLIEPKNMDLSITRLAKWLSPIIETPWDILFNWSYSQSSSYLSRLIPAHIKLGYTRKSDGSISTPDGWSQYIQGAIQASILQNIHLTDILTTQMLTALQIHLGEPLDEGHSLVTSKSFFTLQLSPKEMEDLESLTPNTKWIAIQISAAQRQKSIHPTVLAHATELLLKKHQDIGIILLGSEFDGETESKYLSAFKDQKELQVLQDSGRILNFIGHTRFDLWASIISKSHWLISADTSALHLGSVLGTRILNISLGDSNFNETGPYGNGHYILKSKRSITEDITPEAIYGTWLYGSTEWVHRRQITIEEHFLKLGWDILLKDVAVYRSKIRGTNEGGGVAYDPLTDFRMSYSDWYSKVIGHIARAWYCGWVPDIGTDINKSQVDPILLSKIRQTKEVCENLKKLFSESQKISGTIARKTARLKSGNIMSITDREELRNFSEKLTELDQFVEHLCTNEPATQFFSNLLRLKLHNIRAEKLSEVSKQTTEIYQLLLQSVNIMNDWIDHTLSKSRPTPITLNAKIIAYPQLNSEGELPL